VLCGPCLAGRGTRCRRPRGAGRVRRRPAGQRPRSRCAARMGMPAAPRGTCRSACARDGALVHGGVPGWCDEDSIPLCTCQRRSGGLGRGARPL